MVSSCDSPVHEHDDGASASVKRHIKHVNKSLAVIITILSAVDKQGDSISKLTSSSRLLSNSVSDVYQSWEKIHEHLGKTWLGDAIGADFLSSLAPVKVADNTMLNFCSYETHIRTCCAANAGPGRSNKGAHPGRIVAGRNNHASGDGRQNSDEPGNARIKKRHSPVTLKRTSPVLSPRPSHLTGKHGSSGLASSPRPVPPAKKRGSPARLRKSSPALLPHPSPPTKKRGRDAGISEEPEPPGQQRKRLRSRSTQQGTVAVTQSSIANRTYVTYTLLGDTGLKVTSHMANSHFQSNPASDHAEDTREISRVWSGRVQQA